jgi:hypothetical protein
MKVEAQCYAKLLVHHTMPCSEVGKAKVTAERGWRVGRRKEGKKCIVL